MRVLRKLLFIMFLALLAYSTAWITAYQQSSDYFEFARKQVINGDLVGALKGMNKLDLTADDRYLGGFQQVVETWESSFLGPKPAFFSQASQEANDLLARLPDEQLLDFIDVYVQLDLRYVPEAAEELLRRADKRGDKLLLEEMEEFLAEAFPDFYRQLKESEQTP